MRRRSRTLNVSRTSTLLQRRHKARVTEDVDLSDAVVRLGLLDALSLGESKHRGDALPAQLFRQGCHQPHGAADHGGDGLFVLIEYDRSDLSDGRRPDLDVFHAGKFIKGEQRRNRATTNGIEVDDASGLLFSRSRVLRKIDDDGHDGVLLEVR